MSKTYIEDQKKALDALRVALDGVYDEHILGETLVSHWHQDINRLLLDVLIHHNLYDAGEGPDFGGDKELEMRWERLQKEREHL